MYMHTLDGKPASFSTIWGPSIYFVGGRNRLRLVDSLRHLRMEQRWARAAAAKHPGTAIWSDPARYGYVLVEVPV
jgi:hypothetical protein